MVRTIIGPTFPRQFGEHIFQTSFDGVILADPEGRIVAANPAACKMFGRSTEDLCQVRAIDLGDPSDERLTSLWRKLNDDGWAHGEAAFLHTDGTHFVAAVATTTFLDEQNKRVSISVFRDISQVRRLQAELRGTVESIGKLVEARDPYTAGHERRVADIAVHIGRELRLSTEQLEGLRISALIHDVGKIGIPVEILGKPSRLDETEFALIKRHPRIGYEVLRPVDFHWPVAETVLQHHERLDGSGYPQGLKGDAILLDARIIAVADVIEAIASHRPYRPSLGLSNALAEIERERGRYYDPKVVDACLYLFRQK